MITDNRTEKRRIGDCGEEFACRMLARAGYRIADRNYRMRGGELDIIAWRRMPRGGKTLCFIEVKTRRGDAGSAERATDAGKIRRMMTAATHYCIARNIPRDTTPIQFEHVSVYFSNAGATECRHYVLPID